MCSLLDLELRGCVNSWCHFVFKFLVLKSVYMRGKQTGAALTSSQVTFSIPLQIVLCQDVNVAVLSEGFEAQINSGPLFTRHETLYYKVTLPPPSFPQDECFQDLQMKESRFSSFCWHLRMNFLALVLVFFKKLTKIEPVSFIRVKSE